MGSLFIECNQLGGVPTGMDGFRRCELRRGTEILHQKSGVIGGMCRQLASDGIDVSPLIVATACPGGALTAECYGSLKSEMLEYLERALPLDGVLLALHGAAAADGVDDLEGDLLRAVRRIVGEALPIVATLDLHAHVTQDMVQLADALVAWETYPHVDTFSTGERGARLLARILRNEVRPSMAMAKVPVMAGSVHGGTEGDGPFAEVMRMAKSFEGTDGVLSAGAIHVYPYLDAPDLGAGGIVITDGNPASARDRATELAKLYWANRFDLEPTLFAPSEAIQRGLAIEGGPILLVETSDCCGGGAAGDSVATLRSLLELSVEEPCLVPVVDPEAVRQCHQTGSGRRISMKIGHSLDPRWGDPLEIEATIERIGNGRFRYSGGIWEGQMGEMGASAVVSIGGIRVLIMSNATYDWADEQFQSFDLSSGGAKFVVVKNPMNHQLAFRGKSRAAFVLDTPGPTPASLRHDPYTRLRRPYFPVDQEIPGLEPVVLESP